MTAQKHNLLGLTADELADIAESIGQPRYRGRQIFQWLYTRAATDISAMTDLSRSFRERLADVARIEGVSLVTHQRSPHDGTTKHLFMLADGLKIESVLIPPATAFTGSEAATDDEQQRLTLCLSSQVGCPLDCAFCATGAMGYFRNLTAAEIVDQVLAVKRLTGRRITNIVFMGMGEPMMNYETVMKAADIIATGMDIAARRITVSTAGWVEGIRRMVDEKRRMKLAISLHSALDGTRTRLMPITKKFPLADLCRAIQYYYARTKEKITYEYIFFDGINDTEEEVNALIRFARRTPCKINVIPYHSIASVHPVGLGATLRASPRMDAIVARLRSRHLTVFVRSSAGEDIDAACGQLAVAIERTRRSAPAGGQPQRLRRSRPHIHA